MDTQVFSSKLTIVTKQRNFLLLLVMCSLASILILSIKVFTSEARVVIVPPGFTQPLTITNNTVSNSYIEEMTHIFLSNLLDLSPSNLEYKQKIVMKYAIYGGYEDLKKYFNEQQNNHKEFNLRTEFTVKDLEIDVNNLTVIAKGLLTLKFGKHGHEEKETSYRIKYDYKAGFLRIKEFKELIEVKDNTQN